VMWSFSRPGSSWPCCTSCTSCARVTEAGADSAGAGVPPELLCARGWAMSGRKAWREHPETSSSAGWVQPSWEKMEGRLRAVPSSPGRGSCPLAQKLFTRSFPQLWALNVKFVSKEKRMWALKIEGLHRIEGARGRAAAEGYVCNHSRLGTAHIPAFTHT
jgi:hypothetical protein